MYRQVRELEIAGYANVLKATMLPVVVPPVFRLKTDPQRIFLPPYSFNAGLLCNATEVDAEEMAALEAAGELTLFEQPFPAQPGFELWIDQSFAHHYEPRSQADQTLLSIARGSIQQAQAALRENNLEEAERLSTVALSADDRLVEPLAVKAAIRRLHKDRVGEQLMRELAADRLSETAFGNLVDSYVALAPQTTSPQG
ncbi:MAG: hypothetical protein FJ279_21115 [Planctomycetes bacterium]|nr:hypothetical protein [Planctomycetota bacterium]